MTGHGQKLAKTILLTISILMLPACMPKVFPFPSPEVVVSKNMIYSGGKPFAEVRYLELFDPAQFRDMSPKKARGRGWGLVMYYFRDDKEVWIHPAGGLTIRKGGTEYTRLDDMKRVWQEFIKDKNATRSGEAPDILAHGHRWNKDDAITSVVYDVRISGDGRYVHYKSQGVLFDTPHTYRVEEGR